MDEANNGIQQLDNRQRLERLRGCFAQDLPVRVRCPTVIIEILDREVARDINPCRNSGDVVNFWGLTEPTTIKHEGVEVYRLVPAPDDVDANSWITRDEDDVIRAALGVDDTTESSAEFLDPGAAAIRDVLAGMPRGTMPEVQGCPDVRLTQAEDVGRWFGMSPNEIAKHTGRDFKPHKLLLHPGAKANSLALHRAKAEAAAAAQAEVLRAEMLERTTPNARPLGEIAGGLEAIVVPLGDVAVQVPLALQTVAPLWQDTDGRTYFVWRSVPGMRAPECQFAGASVLPPSHVVALAPAKRLDDAPEPSQDVVGLVTELRRKHLPALHRGKVQEFGKLRVEGARALAGMWADALYQPRHGQRWRAQWLLEAVVRGYLVTAPLAVALVWEALVAKHEEATGTKRQIPKGTRKYGSIDAAEHLTPRMHPPKGTAEMVDDPTFAVPGYPSTAVQRADVERYAVEASQTGEVEPGCLIANTTTSKGTKRSHGATHDHAKA